MSEIPKIDGLPTVLIRASLGDRAAALGAQLRNDRWAQPTPRQLQLLELFRGLPSAKQMILYQGALDTGVIPARVIEQEARLKDKMGLSDTTKSDLA